MGANFLWVGREVDFAGSTRDKILKYCFNDPRNWRKEINGVLSVTNISPGASDAVFFGDALINTAGWTSTKSPCLYGGFYNWNGITPGRDSNHLGSWAYTGTTMAYNGNFNPPFDWSFSYLTYAGYGGLGLDFSNRQYSTTTPDATNDTMTNGGYRFPYLGGGITGEIAAWCAARDGLSVGDYSIANAGGIHNPSNNLKIFFNSNSNGGNRIWTEQNHRLLATYAGSDPVYITGLEKLVIDIENVPAYSYSAPAGTFPNHGEFDVYTNGSGVILRKMFAETLRLNYRTNPNWAPANIGAPRDQMVDYGIQIIDPMVANIYITPQQKIHVIGGEVGRVFLGITEARYSLFGGSTSGYILSGNEALYNLVSNNGIPYLPYSPAPAMIFENGWNYQLLYPLLYGLTGAQIDALDGITWNLRGSISSQAEVSRDIHFGQNAADDAQPVLTNEGFYRYPFSNLYAESQWRNFYHDIIVKPGVHSANPSPDTVQLSGYDSTPIGNNPFTFIRPRLLISGNGPTASNNIPRIWLQHAVVAIDPNEPPASITNLETTLKKNSVVDFTTAPSFQKWYSGYLTGTGDFGIIGGGIIFADDTDNIIKGDTTRAFYAAGWIDDVDLRTAGLSGAPSLPSVP